MGIGIIKKKPNENIIELDSILDFKRCSDIIPLTKFNPNPEKIPKKAVGSKLFENIPNLVKLNADHIKNSAFFKKFSVPKGSSIQNNNLFGVKGNDFKNRFQNVIKPFNKITILLLSIWVFTTTFMYFF